MLTIWLGVMLAMGVLIGAYPQIDINPTFKSMIMSSDPDRAFDQKVKETFGDDEYVIIAVENEQTVFNVETLRLIDRITQKVRKLDGVRDIYSLTYIDNIRSRDGLLDTNDLIEALPTTKEELARIEKEAGENATYENFIISPDKKVAAINVELALTHSDSKARGAITEKILSIVDEERKSSQDKIYVTGFPVSSYFGGIFMISDMVVFGAAAAVLLMILMWFIFRNVQGVAFTMLVAMAGVAVTYGLMSAIGVKITMPLSSVMIFIMALGMEYSIYVGYAFISQVLHERSKGGEIRDRSFIVSEAVRGVRSAVLLSTTTTCIGFLSMVTNPVPDLAKMGFFLAIGTLTVGIASLTIVPAVITMWPFEVRPHAEKGRFVHWFVGKLGGGSAVRPRRALLAMGVISAFCLAGWAQVSADTDAMQYFKKGSRIRQDEEFVRARMAGTTYLQAVVETEQLDYFKEPENLAKLEKVAAYAESLPNVTKALSHADHLKLLNKALRGPYELPDTRQAVEQFLLLHKQPDDFRPVIDPDYKRASVMVRLDTMSSTRLREVEEAVETFMAGQFSGKKVNLVGTTLLVHRAFDMMARSMVIGLGIACVLIWLIMCIGFRSVKMGTLALVPNAMPILLIYSVLGWIGYPLDPPTAVTGAIALGIAVDDTVHFFKGWRANVIFDGMTSEQSVLTVLQRIGRPMVMSSLVLAFGFGVLMLSRYGTLVWMGIMLSVAAATALICDLVLTPALLAKSRVKVPEPTEEEMKAIKPIDNVAMDPKRQSLSEYSDEEIDRMLTYDFFAIAGKTVIRQGGNFGTRRLLYEMKLTPSMHVLEIGAGVGATAFSLAKHYGCRVTCVDLSDYMIEVARKRAEELGVADKCDFVVSTGATLPFEENTFDAVISESVVMYAGTGVFKEAHRVLKPEGVFGLHDWSWANDSLAKMQGLVNNVACCESADACTFFAMSGWRAELEAAGFRIDFSEQFPFAYFAMSGMVDDEGAMNVAKMFGRILSRPAAVKKMIGIMSFLDKYQTWFTYTLVVGSKKEMVDVAEEPPVDTGGPIQLGIKPGAPEQTV